VCLCIFCRQKSIKKDIKLKRIESSERVKYILNAARGKFDYDLLSLLTVDKEKNLSNKEDIVNAFLFSKRSWCKMSKNFLNAIPCSDSFQKAIKKDRKLKRIENSERVKYILKAARGKFDYDLLSLLTVDDVQEKVQYHSACITNYLLKWKKEHRADNYFQLTCGTNSVSN
jgi:hypothetical protein